MNRKRFIFKSAGFLMGNLLGLNAFSKAFARTIVAEKSFSQPRIALIIDDIGHSRSIAAKFVELNTPLTFAILPHIRHSSTLAFKIHNRGHEIMLHQPMEPYNADSFDPGPGALYVGDSSENIKRVIEANLSVVPFAIGVNNHMGSKFTECRKEITQSLCAIKRHGLFFVDSITSHRSIAYKTARNLGMPSTGRNIFLDNINDEAAILDQLLKLKHHALQYGRAVGIGHPFPETAAAIGRFIKNLKGSGVSMVHVSAIL